MSSHGIDTAVTCDLSTCAALENPQKLMFFIQILSAPVGDLQESRSELTNISSSQLPHFTQTVFVDSKQSVAYKTQSGTSYGSMTNCKVNFKVF